MLDTAAVGGIVGAATLLLGGMIWWCNRQYAIYMVKQRRSRRWKAQRVLAGAVPVLPPRPGLRVIGRTQMKSLVAKTRPPIILQDPAVKNGSASIAQNTST